MYGFGSGEQVSRSSTSLSDEGQARVSLGGVPAILDAEFAENAGDVAFARPRAAKEALRNLRINQVLSQQVEHIVLAWGEAVDSAGLPRKQQAHGS